MKNSFISKWSEKIEELDRKLLKLIARRKTISECIGRVNALNGLEINDDGMEMIIIQEMQRYAYRLGFTKNFTNLLEIALMNLNKEVLDRVSHSLNKGSSEKTIERNKI